MKIIIGCLLMLPVLVQCSGPKETGRPNILWITCEDISPYLGCYGFEQAQTPNLDRLAKDGIRYTRAYANAPVCAVSRSMLLTGMYSSSIGTHNMRCYTQLPASIPAYPKIFREAGYYCTNNVKKDYNSPFQQDTTLWDESSNQAHFRNRNDGQPFFAVFNFTVTHESQLSEENQKGHIENGRIPDEPRIDPEDIELPPYHPDLPVIRRDWARLHDLITRMDEQVGEILQDLEDEGQAENTIVFFYSDHGGMLARSKRYLYNVGTQVPLIVRFPERWHHLAPGRSGSTEDRLVSFIDFPKTVLSICGLPVPAQMQGTIFMGPDTEPSLDRVWFMRDRMSERFDFSRAVTDGRYYYIRNFMPHRPRGRDITYGYWVQSNWSAWRSHYEADQCDEVQSQFFQPKPAVQFFDTEEDPWHVNNIAGETEQLERIGTLSAALDEWMIETRDLGIVPEAMYDDLAGPGKSFPTIYEYARSEEYPVEKLLQAAKSASLCEPGKMDQYLRMMEDDHPVVRYWGTYAIFLLRKANPEVQSVLRVMMREDPAEANRVMAAQALGLCGDPDAAFQAIRDIAFETQSPTVFLQAINAFQYSHLDERLTMGDWKKFSEREIRESPGKDMLNRGHAQRIITHAIEHWPERYKVY
ncbi:MAG: sulfatase-like hydrolase/transferase [Bacteroidales bacterium]